MQVVDEFPGEFEVVGLAAGSNMDLLAEQIAKHRPKYAAAGSREAAVKLGALIKDDRLPVMYGDSGLESLAGMDGLDLVLVAVSGIKGLRPTIAALERGTAVALANKETLVTAGDLVVKKARERKTRILPVDSEHSAIFQCFEERNSAAVEKLLLTASGGPFLKCSATELDKVKPAQALRHPRWRMGAKITIDSAGLVNKGLEVIEAHWLYDMPYEKIEVLIHPQSIIHSMVQYADGSVLAQCSLPDMRLPIQYAFFYPERRKNSFPRVDFSEVGELTFMKPDQERFPGLGLAYEAGKAGGTMPAVYNGANEKAVELFLAEKIKFSSIPAVIENVMKKHRPLQEYGLEEILEIDRWSRLAAVEAVY
jgi:1-deoxy-D-xylulose-5-phosphate reductoisomerase